MPKKSSSKPEPEDPVGAEEKTSSTPKKPTASSTPKKTSNEIDEIFGKKRKKADKEKSEKPKEDGADKQEKLNKKKKRIKSSKESESAFLDPPPRSRRRTNDGLAVYSAEELGFGKEDAGGTPLCPFDCSCCF